MAAVDPQSFTMPVAQAAVFASLADQYDSIDHVVTYLRSAA